MQIQIQKRSLHNEREDEKLDLNQLSLLNIHFKALTILLK